MAPPSKGSRGSQQPAARSKNRVQKKPAQPRSGKDTLPADQHRQSNGTKGRQTGKGKKLQEKKEDVKKDPMKVLNADVIALIFSALAPADTESMRRVSRIWKAVSEYHCVAGLLREHFPSAHSIPDNNLSGEDANMAYRRRVYHLKNLKRGMATRAANFDNVIDWHIMGDQLVYACKPRGAIRVRILRGADGKACNFSEWTMFKLAKENGGRQSMPVFVQSFNNRDLFITACSKPPSSASSPDALYQDTILMRVSPHEKQRMKYRNYPSVREVWYMIGEDNLKFKIDLAGQMICKPALGQDCAYFVQNRSTDTGRNQPRFTKVSTADGTILFSKTIPEIREAGIIHDNGRSFTPVHSHDAKASHPGRAIEVPDHDKQMELTKSEDVAIWSDEELRMYIFCTDTGTLLYTYDRHSNSSVSMCLSEDGFWYGYQRPAPYGRYLTHYFCTFSKTQGRVLWGRPAFQYQKSGAYPIFGDQCVDVQVKHEHVKNPESMLRNSTLTMDPLTTFHICTMETRSYQREQVPKWLNWATMPRFNSNPVQEQQHYLLLEPRDKPYKRMKLKRGNRTLNASIHFGGRETESCQMVNGYLIYTNPRINQLILIDFFPEW